MRKFLYYLQLIIILSIFWIMLLNGSRFAMISAPFISTAALIISERFFLQDSYYNRYYINFFKGVVYFLTLMGQIYQSSFALIPVIFSRRANPQIVDITTSLTKELDKTILCNSITLTPGTITMDVEGENIKVLWLKGEQVTPEVAGEQIKGTFERLLERRQP